MTRAMLNGTTIFRTKSNERINHQPHIFITNQGEIEAILRRKDWCSKISYY